MFLIYVRLHNPHPHPMTTEQRKELKAKFDKKFTYEAGDGWRMDSRAGTPDHVFDFFYSEIEARHKKHEEEWMLQLRAKEDAIKLYQKIHDKLQRLEEIIKAANEVIKTWQEHFKHNYRYDVDRVNRLDEALEHYQHLKEKQK
jgi:hypothetical protein